MANYPCFPCQAAEACVDACDCGFPVAPARARQLRQWAWWLTALTIGWNSLEAVVTLVQGALAGSIALVGFGLDSILEVASAVIIVWRLATVSADAAADERAERRAVRLIAVSFFAIAVYVGCDAVAKLLGLGSEPQRSPLGLTIVALSLLVMPVLSWAKRRVARGLGSAALRADAAQTQLCTYLSSVVLLALAANALFGWWWVDPLAGLFIAAVAIQEGRTTWASGEICCD
jgi:divalent metal cation (Fe/Co/Zn/Cd) transporter